VDAVSRFGIIGMHGSGCGCFYCRMERDIKIQRVLAQMDELRARRMAARPLKVRADGGDPGDEDGR